MIAAIHKCENNSGPYCAAPVNIHRIDWMWANKAVFEQTVFQFQLLGMS